MEWNIANSWTVYVLSTLTKTGPTISSEVCLSHGIFGIFKDNEAFVVRP